MTWPWLIFFSAACCGFASAAMVNGQVELVNSREASVRKQADYSGVVVELL